MLVTRGLGWGGLPTASLGFGVLLIPPIPPTPPVGVSGGGGGGPGGGRGWYRQEECRGRVDDECVLDDLGMLDFGPIPMADLGIDPEAEGARSSTDVTGPPLEDEPAAQPQPKRRRVPGKKKAAKTHPVKRVGNVAMGLGRLYMAGRGVQKVADAIGAGDFVGAAKHAVKFTALRGLFKSGVSSVLDGIDPEGEDGRKKKGG